MSFVLDASRASRACGREDGDAWRRYVKEVKYMSCMSSDKFLSVSYILLFEV